MALKDFLKGLDEEVSSVLSSDFEIQIIDTNYVPSFNDPNITFDNLDSKKKKCKRLESCVLYVDIRNSVQISAERRPKTLAKIYSTFVRTMIACARYYGGHVRNIIGDRVMVVFDKEKCFTKAVDTAVLMNSVCKHILNNRITSFDFSAGVGIDYGQMLITKSGAIRKGEEKEFYRSLVWLGKPANIASRLTDIANKKVFVNKSVVHEGLYYKYIDQWSWSVVSSEKFLSKLEKTFSRYLKHPDEHFSSFFMSEKDYEVDYQPILMTNAVYKGYKAENPESEIVKNNWFRKQSLHVKDYDGDVYGGSVIKTAVEEI